MNIDDPDPELDPLDEPARVHARYDPFGRIVQLVGEVSKRGNVVDSRDVAALAAIVMICQTERGDDDT
jgi:hypothetical protein